MSSANTVKDFENEPFEETFEKVFRSKKGDHETQWLIQSKFFKLQLGNKYGTNTIMPVQLLQSASSPCSSTP